MLMHLYALIFSSLDAMCYLSFLARYTSMRLEICRKHILFASNVARINILQLMSVGICEEVHRNGKNVVLYNGCSDFIERMQRSDNKSWLVVNYTCFLSIFQFDQAFVHNYYVALRRKFFL